MTFAAITTLPKTIHNTSTLNTGETSSNDSVKLSLSPQKSSHATFLTGTRFIQDPGCKPAVEKQTYSPLLLKNVLLSLWPGQKSASISISRNRFIPRTYFVRPKTCYFQQQSSQYPIFPSQARDQSFTRVA